MMNTNALVFGEILWDIFGEKRELGGAPLNFACHFALCGGKPFIVSAVGNDENGDKALIAAESYGVDTSPVARSTLPTGYCRVTLKDGIPSYELARPVAYDAIPYPDLACSGGFDGFYFGTLAQRDAISRTSLFKLISSVGFREVFFDVNIRQSFYTADIISASLGQATVLKTSREEIGVFGALGLSEGETAEDICRSLSSRHANLKHIIVTLDKDGAALYDCARQTMLYSEKPSGKAVSTVGAGDSFSACFFANYLRGESPEVCLSRAVAVSDYIVTVLGAVCEYPTELKERIGL